MWWKIQRLTSLDQLQKTSWNWDKMVGGWRGSAWLPWRVSPATSVPATSPSATLRLNCIRLPSGLFLLFLGECHSDVLVRWSARVLFSFVLVYCICIDFSSIDSTGYQSYVFERMLRRSIWFVLLMLKCWITLEKRLPLGKMQESIWMLLILEM